MWIIWGWILKTHNYFIEHLQELFTSLESYHAQLIYVTSTTSHDDVSEEYVNTFY